MGQIILTAVGPDRAGIVADLSKRVHDLGANIADSRMVNLRGHFALLAMVEGPADALARLRDALTKDKSALGLSLEIVGADTDGYEVDGLRPAAVVRPSGADDIAAVLRFATERHLAVTPRDYRARFARSVPLAEIQGSLA